MLRLGTERPGSCREPTVEVPRGTASMQRPVAALRLSARRSNGFEFAVTLAVSLAVGAASKTCGIETGKKYVPDLRGQERTIQDDWLECQDRCRDTHPCKYWTFWPDGGCHLQGPDAHLADAAWKWGHSSQKKAVLAGPAECDREVSDEPGDSSTAGATGGTSSGVRIRRSAAQAPTLAGSATAASTSTTTPIITSTTPSTAVEKKSSPLLATWGALGRGRDEPETTSAGSTSTTWPAGVHERICPGTFQLEGHGRLETIPTGWANDDDSARLVEVDTDGRHVIRMGGRGYFADNCTAGVYDYQQYVALNLLGKTLTYTTDISGLGCGCNAAMYLVSMRQNDKASECGDYYCDANNVCGVSCSEIDIQEANMFAWHSTLHSSEDHNGAGKGCGGGSGWDGPRDWTLQDFGPQARCIDTTRPFQVAVSFPVDSSGTLQAMTVTLTQEGTSCPLSITIDQYAGMDELTAALGAGMTPVISYWSDDDMLWMDGKGADGQGPCERDDASACPAHIKFYDFSVVAYGSAPADNPDPAPAPSPEPQSGDDAEELEHVEEPAPQSSPCARTRKEDCGLSMCCADAGMQCYRKDEYWAACQSSCTAGIDLRDAKGNRSPWSCQKLGKRTPGEPDLSLEDDAMEEADGKKEDEGADNEVGASERQKETQPPTTSEIATTSSSPAVTTTVREAQETSTAQAKTAAGASLVSFDVAREDEPNEDASERKQPDDSEVEVSDCAAMRREDCGSSKCCRDAGMQCYQKNEYWAACQSSCTPGIDKRDDASNRSPWSCKRLGSRAPGEPDLEKERAIDGGVETDAEEEQEEVAETTIFDQEMMPFNQRKHPTLDDLVATIKDAKQRNQSIDTSAIIMKRESTASSVQSARRWPLAVIGVLGVVFAAFVVPAAGQLARRKRCAVDMEQHRCITTRSLERQERTLRSPGSAENLLEFVDGLPSV